MKLTNRTWEKHLKAKGFIPFIYDRLSSYAMAMPRQGGTPFDFLPNKEDENPLAEHFFKYSEEFPYVIYIELTNKCNLDCLFCARKVMKREQGIMDMKLYRYLIYEIAEKMPHCQVHMYGIGESTLDPDLIEKLEYAVGKGLTNIVLFTNGQKLLENDLYKKIVDTRIGTIGIDCDGFSEKAYNAIRKGGEFSRVMLAINMTKKYIEEKGSNQRLELAYQIYKDINEQDVEPFIQWCNENDIEYKIVPMHQWAGLREDVPIKEDLDDSREKKRDRPCCAQWQGMMIYWNGLVGVCFQDADGTEVLGDLNMEEIETIWKGELRRKRKEHVSCKFTGLCEGCKEYLYNSLPECGSKIYPEKLRE